MLKETIVECNNKLRLLQYRSLFRRIKEKTGSLSATEAYAVDVIFLLGEPTIKQFSEFIGISQPNASYKVNSLMAKGYITKEVSEDDRREYHLRVTDKFLTYYESLGEFVNPVVDRLGGKYTQEQIDLFDEMLGDVMQAPEIKSILEEPELALRS